MEILTHCPHCDLYNEHSLGAYLFEDLPSHVVTCVHCGGDYNGPLNVVGEVVNKMIKWRSGYTPSSPHWRRSVTVEINQPDNEQTSCDTYYVLTNEDGQYLRYGLNGGYEFVNMLSMASRYDIESNDFTEVMEIVGKETSLSLTRIDVTTTLSVINEDTVNDIRRQKILNKLTDEEKRLLGL